MFISLKIPNMVHDRVLLYFFALMITLPFSKAEECSYYPEMDYCQCTNTGASNIMTDLSFCNKPNASMIRIENNPLQTLSIENNTEFTYVRKAKMFALGQNKISKIEENSFDIFTELTYITLFDNELSNISPDLFSKNNLLLDLSLGKNKLDKMPVIYSESIEKLSVGNNQIKTITLDDIKHLPKLKVLNIQYNQIQTIDIDVTKAIVGSSSLHQIIIRGNPWSCSCTTVHMIREMKEKLTIFNDIKCYNNDAEEAIADFTGIVDKYKEKCLTDMPTSDKPTDTKILPRAERKETEEANCEENNYENSQTRPKRFFNSNKCPTSTDVSTSGGTTKEAYRPALVIICYIIIIIVVSLGTKA